MIDLALLRTWGTTAAAVLFCGLWQLAEHNTRTALKIAAETVETNGDCVASYAASAASMNAAVDALTLQLRAE